MVKWLDRLQQRSRAAGFVIAVVYKYVDDQANYLAALITYYAFVSLFPLLLLLTTTLGVVLGSRPEWRESIVDSAISQFPLLGSQLSEPQALSGGTTAVVVGIVGALYGGLGVGQALQNAMDSVWSVPRFTRRDPLRARLHSLLLLMALGSSLIGTTMLTALGRSWSELGVLGTVAVVAASVTLNTAVCVVAFRVTTVRSLTVAQVLPGAMLAAVIWQMLQWFGAAYAERVAASSSVTNGVFAIVLGMLAFLFLVSTVLMVCAEINVVRVDRLYPRALLTPFTDNVDLTEADRRAYSGQAEAQRVKSFQQVAVSFDDGPGDDAADGEPDEQPGEVAAPAAGHRPHGVWPPDNPGTARGLR